MRNWISILLTDAYKISHPEQYPDGTEYVYSNITPRSSRITGVNEVVVFGLQYFIKGYLINDFKENFFGRQWSEVETELTRFFGLYFGPEKVDLQIYKDLHELGYLPLRIKALPEGTRCPVGVPFATIVNTDPRFGWLTNAIETLSQNTVWNPLTSATIAARYRDLLDEYAAETSDNPEFVDFQGHNFSMRGMSSLESAVTTDAGHLLSFRGSDTLPGFLFMEDYYGADPATDLISCSVPATEHAIVCAAGKGDERETFRRLIQDVYPSGIVSLVSDTWNLWKVLTEIAPSLRDEIEARDGKVVFRPDSGDPVKIVCGYFVKRIDETEEAFIKKLSSPSYQLQMFNTYHEHGERHDAVLTSDGYYLDENGRRLSLAEVEGCIKLLDSYFGSTVNGKGYRELNPKVGLIYGDSITFDRCERICKQLKAKGYASTNVVFGIGSFTYQYNTRDTFSIACKATWAQVKGVGRDIFKDPITDDGTKKSACGRLLVERDETGTLVLRDQVSADEEKGGELQTVFEDGALLIDHDLSGIRWRLNTQFPEDAFV